MSGAALKPRTSGIMPGSVGINIPQVVIAGVESMLVQKDMKDAAFVAAAVGISNLIPMTDYFTESARSEKYLVEPVAAGLLYAAARYMYGKKGTMLKDFGKGFLIGSSSAVLAIEAMSMFESNPAPDRYTQYRERDDFSNRMNVAGAGVSDYVKRPVRGGIAARTLVV